MLQSILSELTAYSAIELAAVLTAVAYILLAARNNRLCWIAAFISSALFAFILWQAKLLMDAGLNVYYVAMAVYGWTVWKRKLSDRDNSGIERKPLHFHAQAIAAIILLSITSGWLLDQYTDAAFPYLDSLTTWGALFATWLLARKVLENWLYWIVLDSISIYLYFHKDLHFTMLLFIVYVAMSIYAYFHWQSQSGTIANSSTATNDARA